MDESDEAAQWVRNNAARYGWGGDLKVITTEAEALGADGRRAAQRIFEQLFFEDGLNERLKRYGTPGGDDAG